MNVSNVLIEEVCPGVISLSLNRPNHCNALNQALVMNLHTVLSEVEAMSSCHAVLLSGQGKHFCAGLDLKEASDTESNAGHAEQLARLLERLWNFPKPIIAAVQGAAIGGGVGIVACADVVIAASDARFVCPEVTLGLVPAVIGGYLVDRLGLSAAMYHAMTAEPMSVKRAHLLGFVHQLVDADALMTQALQIAQGLTQHDVYSLETTKRLLKSHAQGKEDLRRTGADHLVHAQKRQETQVRVQSRYAWIGDHDE